MQATRNCLIGKKRFTSRSDREREKLQAVISTYSIRYNADRDAEERRTFERRLQAASEPPTVTSQRNLEAWLTSVVALVERVVPCHLCGRVNGCEISCPSLTVTLGA
ncbi:MAG: hypothetical protein ACRD3L_10935 [Terriglobales bacterium]